MIVVGNDAKQCDIFLQETMQCKTMRFIFARTDAMQKNAIPLPAKQCNAVQCNFMYRKKTVMRNNAMRYLGKRCDAPQCNSIICKNDAMRNNAISFSAKKCDAE